MQMSVQHQYNVHLSYQELRLIGKALSGILREEEKA